MITTSPRPASRWLAPLALLAAGAAAATIAFYGAGGRAEQGSAAPTKTKARGPSRYTVRPGDTLSEIAARYGVPIVRVEQLNPGVDSFTMQPGQRLQLRAGR